MENYCFDQSEADTILFCLYAILRESGYTGPVVIDATDTCCCSVLSRSRCPECSVFRKNKKTVSCRDLVTDDMADCIVQLRCMTGCDANSGFYGKGKKTQYDRVS